MTVDLDIIHQQTLFELTLHRNQPTERFGFVLADNVIVSVNPDGPAERCGVMAEHVVLSVNGASCIDKGGREIMDMMRNCADVRLVTMPLDIFTAIESVALKASA